MQRRVFLKGLGSAASAVLLGAPSATAAAATVAPLRQDLIRQNDLRLRESLATQQLDTHSEFYGGFPDSYGIYHVGRAARIASFLVAGLLSPESSYYEMPHAEERLDRAIGFLRRKQHADGTIDLVTTNFHSPPDTAFAVNPIAVALSCVRRNAADRLKYFQQLATEFLEAAAGALINGGVHTPNHRWVVCRCWLGSTR